MSHVSVYAVTVVVSAVVPVASHSSVPLSLLRRARTFGYSTPGKTVFDGRALIADA